MPAYLVAAINIEDQKAYYEYVRLGGLAIESSTAIPLAVSDEPELVEGTLPGRRIVNVQFEDQEHLRECYHAPGYHKALPHRFAGAKTASFSRSPAFNRTADLAHLGIMKRAPALKNWG